MADFHSIWDQCQLESEITKCIANIDVSISSTSRTKEINNKSNADLVNPSIVPGGLLNLF